MPHASENGILQRLSPGDFGAIEPFLRPVKLLRKQELITPGVPIEYVYFPESGILTLVAGGDKWDTIDVGHIGFEGMTNHVIEPGDTSILRCFVQVPGSAMAVTVAHYAEWIGERSGALRLILRYNQFMAVQVSYTAWSHGSFTIEERLSRWLLMCFDRVNNSDLRLVHEFIARVLAVRRSGVTSALHVLEGTGAIKATRACITLRNRETLIGLAAGSYGAPEREYQRLMGPAPAQHVRPETVCDHPRQRRH